MLALDIVLALTHACIAPTLSHLKTCYVQTTLAPAVACPYNSPMALALLPLALILALAALLASLPLWWPELTLTPLPEAGPSLAPARTLADTVCLDGASLWAAIGSDVFGHSLFQPVTKNGTPSLSINLFSRTYAAPQGWHGGCISTRHDQHQQDHRRPLLPPDRLHRGARRRCQAPPQDGRRRLRARDGPCQPPGACDDPCPRAPLWGPPLGARPLGPWGPVG